MGIHGVRAFAVRHRESLFRFLLDVFGDREAALKFSRFTLARLEAEAPASIADPESPALLLRLARETCQDYLSLATYCKLPLAMGEEAAPVGSLPESLLEPPADCIPPEQRVRLALSLIPGPARLIVRLRVVDRLDAAEIERLFTMPAGALSAFFGRLRRALGPGATLAHLEEALREHARNVPPLAAAPAGDRPPDDRSEAPGPAATSRRASARPHRPGDRAGRPGPARSTGRRPEAAGGPSGPAAGRAAGFAPVRRGPGHARRLAAVAAAALLVIAAWPATTAARWSWSAAPVARSVTAGPGPARAGGATIGRVVPLRGPATPLVDGRAVFAPAETLVSCDSGVQVTLAGRSRATFDRTGFDLAEGSARIIVPPGSAPLAAAGGLRLALDAGSYVLRRPSSREVMLACLAGTARGRSGPVRAMVVARGRVLTLGRDGSPEIRDIADGASRERSARERSARERSERPSVTETAPAAGPASPGLPAAASGRPEPAGGSAPRRAAPSPGTARGYRDFL
jgi:hypothetical protein